MKDCDFILKSYRGKASDREILVCKLPLALSCRGSGAGLTYSYMCQLLWLSTSVGKEAPLALPKAQGVLRRKVTVQPMEGTAHQSRAFDHPLNSTSGLNTSCLPTPALNFTPLSDISHKSLQITLKVIKSFQTQHLLFPL